MEAVIEYKFWFLNQLKDLSFCWWSKAISCWETLGKCQEKFNLLAEEVAVYKDDIFLVILTKKRKKFRSISELEIPSCKMTRMQSTKKRIDELAWEINISAKRKMSNFETKVKSSLKCLNVWGNQEGESNNTGLFQKCMCSSGYVQIFDAKVD